MRKILIAILFLSTGFLYGQSFEGTLTYVSELEISPKMAKMGVTKEMLLDKMKKEGSWSDTLRTTYKKGNYLTLLNNDLKSRSIYKSDSNKIYSLQDGDSSDICTVTDASVDLEFSLTGKLPTVEKLDTITIVNGVSCNIIRVKWKSGTYDYYYNSKNLTVNASDFANHIYDGWAEYLKISNALPLKIVKTTKGMMTITMTLVSSQPEVINEKIFSIPTLISDNDLNSVKTANREVMRIKK
ncbi:MAG: hypothetical protein ACOYO1_13725 [Bacteroidales bacterium]